MVVALAGVQLARVWEANKWPVAMYDYIPRPEVWRGVVFPANTPLLQPCTPRARG